MPKKTYLISACLLGLPTRYDGGHHRCSGLIPLGRGEQLIPICPEQLGGLPTPRPPAEISGGDGGAVLRGEAQVVDSTGKDLTGPFLRGAEAALCLAKLFKVDGAILKSGSPSCGEGRIRDGSFTGGRRSGDGVTAALLKQHGIPVCSETGPLTRSSPSPGRRRSPG